MKSTIQNAREDVCAICRKPKEGVDVQFEDKRFGNTSVFLCWRDLKHAVTPLSIEKQTVEAS